MTSEFLVFTTGRFDRELKKLAASQPDLLEHYGAILDSLKSDPFNRSRRYRIN